MSKKTVLEPYDESIIKKFKKAGKKARKKLKKFFKNKTTIR